MHPLRGTEVAKLLLDHSAHANMQDKQGLSVLMYAAYKGQTETAKLLLNHGAQVNMQSGFSALMEVSKYGHTKVAKLHGARVDMQDSNGWSALVATCIL